MQKQSFCPVPIGGRQSPTILSERNLTLSRSLKLENFRKGASISQYAIIAAGNLFYIFGGNIASDYTSTSTIATFSTVTKTWKEIGKLKRKSRGLGVLALKDEFRVVGGGNTERCIVSGHSVACTAVEPYLSVNGPIIMTVPSDYCQN